jgi:2-phosphosulfolactate phosphatase
VTGAVRFEWAEQGARELAPDSDALVIVDVLSFTTAVSVAVGRGAAVHPTPGYDRRAGDLAECIGGVLAVRRSETDAGAPFSLSPASMAGIQPGTHLVLPSPNGSRIAAAIAGTPAVVMAGCLRNAAAVAGRLRSTGGRISVIAAGERWPDGTLRPALEDALGAGSILSRLARSDLSPEARAAVAMYERLGAEGLAGCVSAVELEQAGWPQDVAWAMHEDAESSVPVLVDGAFQAA